MCHPRQDTSGSSEQSEQCCCAEIEQFPAEVLYAEGFPEMVTFPLMKLSFQTDHCKKAPPPFSPHPLLMQYFPLIPMGQPRVHP